MKTAFLTYSFIFCFQWLLAQETISTADTGIRGTMEQLYENQEYSEAYSLLVKHPDVCASDEELLLKAKILSASSEYMKAKFALNQIAGERLESIAKKEYVRIDELNRLDTNQYPVTIALNPMSTAFNEMPFLCDSIRQILLNDQGYSNQNFPRVNHIEGRYGLEKPAVDSLGWYKGIIKQNFVEVGPAGWMGDSLIFITAFEQKLYSMDKNQAFDIVVYDLKKSKMLKSFRIENEAKNMHPAINGHRLIFSSDMYGGYGGMDLWSAEITESGISSPQNLGAEINSSGNDVFPQWMGEKLYFSSDRTDRGFGGLDLYETDLQSITLLPFPLNTAYDEFGMFSVSADSSCFFSNRKGGRGGDDIYTIVKHKKEDFFGELVGRIEAEGVDFSGAIIEFSEANGNISGYATMDRAGYFKLKHVKGNENYKLKVLDTDLPEGSELQLYSTDGDLIKKANLGAAGVFAIELLAPIDYYLKRKANEDESVLSIDIEGLVSVNDEAEEGLKIYLEDSNGELIGVSTTNKKGAFVFDAMKPDDRYSIRSEVEDPNSEIRILAKDGSVIQTIKPGRDQNFVYVRLSEKDQIITITNEMNEEVKVSENEQFDLPVIHFELDRSILSTESEQSLNRVVQLLKVNPDVNVEVSGHTDSRGGTRYNLDLSQERIDAVEAYLNKSGISRNRFRGKGYGESRLKNHCANGVECTEEQHAVNRRTELRVFKSSDL